MSTFGVLINRGVAGVQFDRLKTRSEDLLRPPENHFQENNFAREGDFRRHDDSFRQDNNFARQDNNISPYENPYGAKPEP